MLTRRRGLFLVIRTKSFHEFHLDDMLLEEMTMT